jgi:predicted transposase YbfD/YdcC
LQTRSRTTPSREVGMSTFDLGLLPSGHLHCFPPAVDDSTDSATHIALIGKAFARSVGEGLFTLAARKSGVNQIALVETERTIHSKTSLEKRYYICSAKLSAKETIQFSRNHWGVESKLH